MIEIEIKDVYQDIKDRISRLQMLRFGVVIL